MLATKFKLVWVLLLYTVIIGVLVISLGIPFAVPVVRVFRHAGVGALVSDFCKSVTAGESLDMWFDKLYAIVLAMKHSLLDNKWAAFSGGLLIALVVIFAFRFFFGLYEIPLADVLEGAMSSNARIGFTGRFVARLGKSCKFVLVKMLYTVVFDFLIGFVVYWLFVLFDVPVLKIFAPFLIMVVYLVLLSFRYTLISMWAPAVVLRDGNIFRMFGFSVQRSVRHMGSIFSTFLVAWTLILTVNMLVGLFTFGAGLVLTVPVSLLFINLLNMTVYYGKTGKRYYTDATTVVTPPPCTEEE